MSNVQSNMQNSARKAAEPVINQARGYLENTVGRENVDSILGMLAPIGTFSLNALRTSVGYTRRHPIRVLSTVIAIGAFASWMTFGKSKSNDNLLH